MAKGIKHDEQDKRDAVAQFNALGGGTKSAAQVGKDFGVHHTTIYSWVSAMNGKKPAKQPKRKTAVKAKDIKSTIESYATPAEADEWETLFNDYITKRNAAGVAREKLEAFVKGLK